MGKNKKLIIIHKFRSMRPNADKEGTITEWEDPRITSFGKFLRKTKIDELPQLWNVLIGEMSFVGPRPESYDVAQYYKGKYEKIFSVKPGLTSPGTLIYYLFYEDTKIPKGIDTTKYYVDNFLPSKLTAELHYCENMNLLYDIKILYKTMLIMLFKILMLPIKCKSDYLFSND